MLKKSQLQKNQSKFNYHDPEQNIPQQFICPISQRIMTQPVLTKDGISFQKQELVKWIQKNHNDPFSRQQLKASDLKPNRGLRDAIQNYLKNLPQIKRQRLQLVQMRNLMVAYQIRQKQIQKLEHQTSRGQQQKQIVKDQLKVVKLQNKLLEQKVESLQKEVKYIKEINELKDVKIKNYQNQLNNLKNQLSLLKSSQKSIKNFNKLGIKENQKFKMKKQEAQTLDAIMDKTEKQRIKKLVQQNQKQKNLTLIEKNLQGEQLAYLLKQLINPKKLKLLNLNDNNIDDEGIKILSRFKFLSLTDLILQQNFIGSQGFKQLTQAFKNQQFNELKILNIKNNKVGSGVLNSKVQNNKGFQFSTLLYLQNLQNLQLSYNKLNDRDIQQLFSIKQIQNNKKKFPLLKNLWFTGNHIKSQGIKALSRIQFTILEIISLAKNNVNKEGIEYFVSNQKAFQNLKMIHLSQNNICTESMKLLCSNKKILNNLQSLNLHTNNNIKNEGILYLIKGTQHFPELQEIFMQTTGITEEAIEYFISNEYKNMMKKIKKINFANNGLKNIQELKKKLENRFKNAQIIN